MLNGQIAFDGGGKKQLPEDCPNGLEYQPSSSRAISPSPKKRKESSFLVWINYAKINLLCNKKNTKLSFRAQLNLIIAAKT